MFENGLVGEVNKILSLGIPSTAKPFESLGYRQALQFVQGHLSFEAAVASAQLETRRYAKRQMTWFRRDADLRWFSGFGDEPPLQDQVCMFLQDNLE
jgi:tRNA dimethylallyltransferase